MPVGHFLDYAAHHYPDKTSIIFKNERLTFAQLKARVEQLSSSLIRLGIKKGDRVATAMWNCRELIEIYLASVRIGAIFTPLNYRLTAEELEYVISDASPAVLIVDQHCRALARKAVLDPGLFERLYSTENSENLEGAKPYSDLIDGPVFQVSIPVAGNDACQLIYTSGTTGKPKGVLLSHDNVSWNCVNMFLRRHDTSSDIALIFSPMYHAAALNSHFTSRLALGATCVIMEKFDPKDTMEMVQRERITSLSGTPTILIMIMEHCQPGDYDTSSVTTITSGTEPLPEKVDHFVRKCFPNIEGLYEIYGSTECSPCVTTLEARESRIKKGSIGPALPFVEVKLLDSENREIQTGEVGEIVVRGSVVMLGYYNQPEETAKVMKDGWFYTGDLAKADEDGYFYFSGRKKDIIKSGGESIAAREVEEVLYKHPDIIKVAVFGVPDEKWGERAIAAIVPRAGWNPTIDSIRKFSRERLAGYKIPREIIVLDKLPETGTGKAQKHELKKIYQNMNHGR